MDIDQATQIGADGQRHPAGTQPTDAATYRREPVTDADLDVIAGWYKIAEQTLEADGPNFDFQDIPDTYQTLRLVGSLRSTQASAFSGVVISFNNDTTDANYAFQRVQGNAAAAASAENTSAANSRNTGLVPGASALADAYGMVDVTISGYADTDRFKHYVMQNAASWAATTGGHLMRIVNGLWRSTAAINRVTVTPGAADWETGSRFALYGVNSPFT